MKKQLLLILLLAICVLVKAQATNKTLNIHPINPYNTDNSELSFLKEYIGNKKYVFIGESAHRGSEYLKMENKICQYLMHEMGFQVLALELGSAEMKYYETKKQFGIEPSILNHLFNPNDPSLITQTINNPNISICGFDNQLTGFSLYTGFLRSCIPILGKGLVDSLIMADTSRFFMPGATKGGLNSQNIFLLNYYRVALERIDTLKRTLGPLAHSYTKMIFENHISWFSNIGQYSQSVMNRRDSVMGNNLNILLSSIFPNQKIIILAHNYHIYKTLPKQSYPGGYNMISRLNSEIIKDSYFICMYAYEGEVNIGGKENLIIQKPTQHYLEYFKTPYPNQSIFIDFISNQKSKKFNKKMKAKYFGGTYTETFVPTQVMDAVIIIDKLEPVEQKKN